MRVSLQFATKRLGDAMLQNAHCKQRSQHRFERPVLSPAAVSQLFDPAHRIGEVNLIKDVSKRLKSAVFQMELPERIRLNDHHKQSPLGCLNWSTILRDKGLLMSFIYSYNKYMY